MAATLAPYRDGTTLQATESSIYFVDAGGAPTGGTYVAGDLAIITPVYNGTAPTASSPFGFRCVTGGTPGTWVAIGAVTTASGAADAITAFAGGGQASATPLTAAVNRIATVASPLDSVALPASSAGQAITIINDAAKPCQVFGVTPDAINDVATATGVMLPAYTTGDFYCPVAGKWYCTNVINSTGATTNLIQYVTVPLTATTINAMNATPIVAIPAQGTGTLIEVQSAVLDLVYGSAAFANGGAAQLSYGSGTTYAASVTVAATVFTTFSANQAIKFAGALAVNATSNCLNTAVNFTNATAAFITGTGATGSLRISYIVHTGLA